MEEFNPKTFTLSEIRNEDGYVVKNYPEILEEAQRIVEQAKLVEIISNDVELKTIKATRTAIRKAGEEVKERRLALVQIMSNQYKSIEDLLKEADDHLKAKVDEYNEKLPPLPKYKLTLTSTNYDTLLKIKQDLEVINYPDLVIKIDEKGE